MERITLSAREVGRLIEILSSLPFNTAVTLRKEVTSEYGSSVFVEYHDATVKTIDITEMDNF